MKTELARRQEGQTLILFALAMLVLLAFLALAIDVGHLYAERRNMQRAADAGALAGARELCFGDPSQAETMAWEYTVTRNGAQTADIHIDGPTVTVVARVTTPTFVAGVVGIHTADVGATAQATCGQAKSSCGVWPVAFSQDRWDEIVEVGGCDTVFYVWSGPNVNNNPDCEVYDCDLNDDGVDDIVAMQGRAWLDFSCVANPLFPDSCTQTGCGSGELSCLLRNDAGTRLDVGSCIDGDNGLRAASKDDVDSRIGDVVRIPLFDTMGCTCDDCGCGNTYHISGFGCVTVRTWIQQLELPNLDGSNPSWKDKAIEVAVNCGGCGTYCGSTGGGSAPDWGVRAVSLTR